MDRLIKKNRAYKNFIRNGQPEESLEAIINIIAHGSKLIEDAKEKYFTTIGRTLSNPETSKRLYWSLINKIMNKAKILNVRSQTIVSAGALQ